MTDNQLDAILAVFQKRMQRVTDEYLRRMGRQIREIGEIIPSAQTRLVQMRKVDMNLKYIQNAIAREAEKSVGDIQVIFKAIAAENIRFAEAYFGGKLPKTFLNQLINAQLKATANELVNLSQTTIESTLYREAVDESIQAVQVGVEDYNSAIRRAVQKAAESGVRFRSASPSVEYPNGRTKRLDSAVRQNVLDGIRKLNQENMKAIGEAFGADGVELTAHMMCADDHLPYQGKQFSNAEFEEIQRKLSRPFGMWNCRHSWSPILMGISEPAYTDAELEQFRQNSTEKIEIDGVTKTRYQWTQEQRKIETAIRYQQDVATAAKATGDTVLKRNAKKTVAALNDYYAKIVDVAGVPDKPDRKGTNYGKGFNIAKQLKNMPQSGIITTTRNLIRSSAVEKTINPEKQNRHILGTAEHTAGRSYIYGDLNNAQMLVDNYHGTGTPMFDKNGNWKNKEVVMINADIGVNVDIQNQTHQATNRFVIHYSKTGTHIVPTKREE